MPLATDVIQGKHEDWWTYAIITSKPFLFWAVVGMAVAGSFAAARLSGKRWMLLAGIAATVAFVYFWGYTYHIRL